MEGAGGGGGGGGARLSIVFSPSDRQYACQMPILNRRQDILVGATLFIRAIFCLFVCS